MSKSILFALVTAASTAVCTENAFAGRHGCCANTCCPVPVCATTTAGVLAAPTMSQANRDTTYQSFSYEPGTTPPMQVAPVYRPMMRPSSQSFYDSIRGDRKALGRY